MPSKEISFPKVKPLTELLEGGGQPVLCLMYVYIMQLPKSFIESPSPQDQDFYRHGRIEILGPMHPKTISCRGVSDPHSGGTLDPRIHCPNLISMLRQF